MPPDDADAPLTAGLGDITRGAIGKGRASMRLSREVALHSSDFDLESLLSLFLGYSADAQADPNPEISLIDESSTVLEDSEPGVRVVAMSSSCRAEEHFRRGCKTRHVVDPRIANPPVRYLFFQPSH